MVYLFSNRDLSFTAVTTVPNTPVLRKVGYVFDYSSSPGWSVRTVNGTDWTHCRSLQAVIEYFEAAINKANSTK